MARARGKLQAATRLRLEHVVRLQLLGSSTRQIAAKMGVQPDTVREWLRHREYAAVREKAVEKTFAGPDEEIMRRAGEILERAAPHAAQALCELVKVENDNVTRRLAARDILDRSGHGPIQRKVAKVRHEIDPVTVELIREAMRESDTSSLVMTEVAEDDPTA